MDFKVTYGWKWAVNGMNVVECMDCLKCADAKTLVKWPPWSCFHWLTCWSEGNDWADRLAGKATLKYGLLLGRSEVLRSLKHYLWALSQGHHTVNHLEERGAERRNARYSSLKGWEIAIVSQTNIGTISKAMLGKLQRDGVERIWAFWVHRHHLELNWTQSLASSWQRFGFFC